MRIDEFVLHYAALFVRRELDGVVTSLAAFLDQALRRHSVILELDKQQLQPISRAS
jgi:hypothetical protein